jgi:polyisoprenoid-binding protein YceI
MSTATTTRIPSGTWSIDRAHSSATFAARHAGLSLFRGSFRDVDAKLEVADGSADLSGMVKVDSIDVDDAEIRPHLLSPEFFDVERHPDVRFRSTRVTFDGDEVRVTGELEIAGNVREVSANGSVRGPVPGPTGAEKLALHLDATIDRTEFGMNWQMDMPDGSPALANDIALAVELELAKE